MIGQYYIFLDNQALYQIAHITNGKKHHTNHLKIVFSPSFDTREAATKWLKENNC